MLRGCPELAIAILSATQPTCADIRRLAALVPAELDRGHGSVFGAVDVLVDSIGGLTCLEAWCRPAPPALLHPAWTPPAEMPRRCPEMDHQVRPRSERESVQAALQAVFGP